MKSILDERSPDDTAMFAPQRFTNIPISVSLHYQNAKGCHLLSALDKRDNTLMVTAEFTKLKS